MFSNGMCLPKTQIDMSIMKTAHLSKLKAHSTRLFKKTKDTRSFFLKRLNENKFARLSCLITKITSEPSGKISIPSKRGVNNNKAFQITLFKAIQFYSSSHRQLYVCDCFY